MQFIRLANVLLGLALSVAAQPTNISKAPVVLGNPPRLFEATLLDKDNTTLRGAVNIWAEAVGVKVHADFWGVPEETALGKLISRDSSWINTDLFYSLAYHIHEAPVPEDGDCYATGAHLDPYGRGQQPPCDITRPETCEVGDLSGKHSPIYTTAQEPFEAEYPDVFISTDSNSPAYFGDLSIVVHLPDETRINCGNFVEIHYDDEVEAEE